MGPRQCLADGEWNVVHAPDQRERRQRGGGGGSTGANLVANGSFETSGLSGWTLGGNSGASTWGPQIFIDTQPESGAHAAGMGSVGSDGTLSQTIATTAGKTYTLSFWLQNEADRRQRLQSHLERADVGFAHRRGAVRL